VGARVGYDLHITRRKNWAGAGSDITVEEWLAFVEKDSEFLLFPADGPYFARWNGKSKYPDPWLDWREGNIYTKNPDEALIDKMVEIARQLNAQVQGDDGEIYQDAHRPPIYPPPSLLDRLRAWLRAVLPAPRIKETVPPFQVGDRVLDAFRKETTVTEIDPKSDHGLGKVKVRYDDGRELTFMLAASGLSPVLREKKE
jgi:hypothetical protein